VTKLAQLTLLIFILVGIAGCESSSSLSKAPAASEETEGEAIEVVEAVEEVEPPSALVIEAEEKYHLAGQLLDFAGPIEDISSESANVRWLAADLLKTAIELDPTEFRYYRDLFMTYMVLQEPVKAMEAIEPARQTPTMADEVSEFQSLVFGALEYASLIEGES
jgi:hypothetical protein